VFLEVSHIGSNITGGVFSITGGVLNTLWVIFSITLMCKRLVFV
jgi:hypothetical protein